MISPLWNEGGTAQRKNWMGLFVLPSLCFCFSLQIKGCFSFATSGSPELTSGLAPDGFCLHVGVLVYPYK